MKPWWMMGLAALVLPAWADGLQSLEQFLQTARAGRASFTQTVTAPARDGQAARTRTSTGRFIFQRPGRFRFDYQRPFEQNLIADGQTLWLYDVDLNQVTARPQAQALGSTPAGLITSAANLRALQTEFTLQNAPDQDGLQWVQASPKSADGQVQSVRVGLRSTDKGPELTVLEILDSFGQRSVLSFIKIEVNPALAADTFSFKPPPGADVVRP